MPPRAVIDIGTNSVKLLVAEVDGPSVIPLWEASEQTRLGQGFYPNRRLQPEAIGNTARAVARFTTTAREWSALPIRAIATSAARDALNQDELLKAISAASSLPVEILSGEQEAEWALVGVRTDPELSREALLVLDIGGGSTQIALSRSPGDNSRRSFPMGGVRLLEQLPPGDPPGPSDWDQCRNWIRSFVQAEIEPWLRPLLNPAHAGNWLLVGTGGTTSMLAAMLLRLSRFDRQKIEQTRLSLQQVWESRELLWSLSLAERRKLAGLPPNRADVILFGVAILAVVMDTLGLAELRVSTRGLRFAALAETAPIEQSAR